MTDHHRQVSTCYHHQAPTRDPSKEFGLSSSAETSAFSEDIFARVPRKESGLNLYQKQEREAVMLVKKQKTYSLLDDDDGDRSSAQVVSESRKADSIRNDSGRRT
ncbi:PREDICTED: pre-mRNA-splicing factor ATP-dependent RNA helicase DEAH1-like [Prunus mume]|uniref:Pre-mRNA-splicing factor ATP-dependent RNA helicase DEAH1-like n=1 Tax=Prunus mume TaxID=102107 RepID=A0ABM0PS33_PRUMU|nr:PREDICTED: pre-mRNA-splicing factor ATP-dependent RNA helicase DEAH1-like [Prunus mume]